MEGIIIRKNIYYLLYIYINIIYIRFNEILFDFKIEIIFFFDQDFLQDFELCEEILLDYILISINYIVYIK